MTSAPLAPIASQTRGDVSVFIPTDTSDTQLIELWLQANPSTPSAPTVPMPNAS